jgi:glycosyltransferase involved in cell wall biosynthesis
MLINHFITTISRGGAENQLLILVKEQVKLGHTVRVFPLKSSLDLESRFRDAGAEVNLDLYGKGLIPQLFYVRKVKFLGEEIVHAHLPHAEILALFAKCKNKVSTRHFGGKFYPRSPRVISSWISRVITRKRIVISISDYVSDYLLASKEVDSLQQVRTVKYGFDSKSFTEENNEGFDFNHDSDTLICGTLARLSPEKDLGTLIRGIYEFKRISSRKITLNIFGEGIERDHLESLVEKLNLNSVVNFLGKTDNPAQALNSMDIFILTSQFEGFGMVLLEAMATHRFIIASAIPTAKEVLGDDGAALFFNVGSPESLAQKISQFTQNTSSDFTIQQDSQLEKFKSNVMARKIDEVYSEVMAKMVQNSIIEA